MHFVLDSASNHPSHKLLGPPTTGPSPMRTPWVTCPHDSLMQQANALIYWINVALIHCLIYALMQCLWPIGSLGHTIVASDTWAHGFLESCVDNPMDSYLLPASSNASDSSVRWFMCDCFNDFFKFAPYMYWSIVTLNRCFIQHCFIEQVAKSCMNALSAWHRMHRFDDSVHRHIGPQINWLMNDYCLNVSVFRNHWFVASSMHGAWHH